MVFNTGAALLDAVVLAMISHEPEGTYGYKITQEVRQVIEISESVLYSVCAGYRKMSVWKRMIWNVRGATGVTTRLRRKEERSLIRILASGIGILPN